MTDIITDLMGQILTAETAAYRLPIGGILCLAGGLVALYGWKG